jgi:archaellum component FlaG (FlaF/FlaG flagellin family)
MGFSTVSAEILFFLAVVAVSAGVIAVFSSYVDRAQGAMSDKQAHIVSQLRTDIALTNIDNSSGHLYIYMKNIGTEQLKADCMNLYVDGGWVNLGADIMVDPATGLAKKYLDSQSTLEFKPIAAPLNSNTVHEAKVVTCNGIWAAENF